MPRKGHSFNTFVESTFNANPALAGLDPAVRAQQLGLQSDGSGGYIDAATGQKVASTVNNELVFYDQQGGAVSDSDGGSTQAGVNPQPTWTHPSGFAMTPPHKPENSDEANNVPDYIPAKAPPGYDIFVQNRINQYNQQQTPIEISSQRARQQGEIDAENFERFNPVEGGSIPDTITNPADYKDMSKGQQVMPEEFSYFAEEDNALRILKNMRNNWMRRETARRKEAGLPPMVPARPLSGQGGQVPPNEDPKPRRFMFQREETQIDESSPIGQRTVGDPYDPRQRNQQYGQRASKLARTDVPTDEFLRGVRGRDVSDQEYQRDVQRAGSLQQRMAGGYNRNVASDPDIEKVFGGGDEGAPTIQSAARQRQFRRDAEDVSQGLGRGDIASYGTDLERRRDLIDKVHDLTSSERLKAISQGGPTFNGDPLETAASNYLQSYPSSMIDYEEDEEGNRIVSPDTVDQLVNFLGRRNPDQSPAQEMSRGKPIPGTPLQLRKDVPFGTNTGKVRSGWEPETDSKTGQKKLPRGDANTHKLPFLRDFATFAPEIFEKAPKLREFLGITDEDFGKSKKLSDLMRLVQDTSRGAFKYGDLEKLNSIMKPGKVSDEAIQRFKELVPNIAKSAGGWKDLTAAGGGADLVKTIKTATGENLADDEGNPYKVARDHRMWTGLDDYLQGYEEDDKEDMMGLLDKYSQIYDKEGNSIYDLRNDEWEPGRKVGGQTNLYQLNNDIALAKSLGDTETAKKLSKFKQMADDNRNTAMIKTFLSQIGQDPYSASGGALGSLTETDLEHIRSLGSGGFDHPDNWVWANRHINQMRGNQPTAARMLKNLIEKGGGDIKKFLENQGGRLRQSVMRDSLAKRYVDALNDPDVDQDQAKQQFEKAIQDIQQYSKINLPDELGDLGKITMDDLSPEMQQKVQGTTLMDVRGGGPDLTPEEKEALMNQSAVFNNVQRYPSVSRKRVIPDEDMPRLRSWLMGESYQFSSKPEENRLNFRQWTRINNINNHGTN